MSEKIKVSWDEVNSVEVDQRLKQQEAFARAQQHVEQQVAGAANAAGSAPRRGSLLNNSLIYMSVFGMAGGLVAWATGELVSAVIPNQLEEFQVVYLELLQLDAKLNRGELSVTEEETRTKELLRRYEANPYVRILKQNEDRPNEGPVENLFEEQLKKDQVRMFIQQIIWFAGIGIPLAFFLSIGDQAAGRNWRGVIVNGSLGLVLGTLGGACVGLFINQLYRAMGGGGTSFAPQMIARTIGWAILGLFLAASPGIVLRNWKRLAIGLAGGLIGGLVGGVLFDPLGLLTGSAVVSRVVAIVAIGVVTGLGTGLLENAAKTGWMRVTAGLIAGKQFILYQNPTYVGSSPQCQIYLFKDAQISPRHAALHAVPGGFEIEDLGSNSGTFVNGHAVRRQRLRNDDQVQVGSTVFSFQEKARTHS